MSLQLFPEYKSFAYVKVDLQFPINGESQTISISKIGERLRKVSIKEGSTGESEQFSSDLDSLTCASGDIELYDIDNSIFRSFMASRGSEGNTLQIRVDIELRTYTGNRNYSGLVSNWNINFSGGIPIITINWKQIGSVLQQSTTNSIPDINEKVNKLVKELTENGISSISEFYSIVRNSGVGITIKAQSGDNTVEASGNTINGINVKVKTEWERADNTSVYRFKLKNNGDKKIIFDSMFSELVQNVELENNQRLFGTYISSSEGNGTYLLYTSRDIVNRIIPSNGMDKPLEDVVFIYNASAGLSEKYKMPDGSYKTVFPLTQFNCSISNQDVIYQQNSTSNGKNNPNGNIVITSKGLTVFPTSLPSALTQALYNAESVSFSQSLTIRVSTYNFIHFYVCGETLLNVIIFDHLGQIHPLSGKMRVFAYNYTISGGALEVDLTLKPRFLNDESSYLFSSGNLRNEIIDGSGNIIKSQGSGNIIKSQLDKIKYMHTDEEINPTTDGETSSIDDNSGFEGNPNTNISSNYQPIDSDLKIINNLGYKLI